jgi:hypothetical protein
MINRRTPFRGQNWSHSGTRTSGDERVFLLEPQAIRELRDKHVLEQVLTQLVGRKVGR